MIQSDQPSVVIAEFIEQLMAWHRRIEEPLAVLARAVSHFRDDRQQALSAIGKSMSFLESSGALHMLDEEDTWFALLWPHISIDEASCLELLERQHDELESVFAKLKEIVAHLPEAPGQEAEYGRLAEELTGLYRSHIQTEDEVLTRLSRHLRGTDQLKAISKEMRKRRGDQDQDLRSWKDRH